MELKYVLNKLWMYVQQLLIDEDGKEHHTIYMKEGMTIMVTGTKDNPVFEQYILVDLSKILESDYSGWKFAGSTIGSGGLGVSGNIDGGTASSRYTGSQIINCGDASSRGETDDE